MHYSKPLSARRPRPVRQITRRPVGDLHTSHDGALVIPYAPRRLTPAVPSPHVKAIAAFSHFVIEGVPNFLLAVVSLIFAEAMAGCAAYAEAMYGIPLEAAEPVPAEMPPRPGVSLTLIHAGGDAGRREVRTRASAPAASSVGAEPGARRALRLPWHVRLLALVSACRRQIRQAREQRQAIAELHGLDDRSLRDLGLSRCDIEYIVWHGARRE